MIKFTKFLIQKIVRFINVLLFKKELPTKISIYFHDLSNKDLDELERILFYFSKRDYKFVELYKFNESLDSNDKLLSITFDDGFQSWTNALPIFSKYNAKATFFMNTIMFTTEQIEVYLHNINFSENSKLINLNDLNSILNEGHEIGAHSHEHHTLTDLKLDEFKEDLDKNIRILNNFKVFPKTFAIPFGMKRYITSEQISHLYQIFDCIAYGEPGLQFNQKKGSIQRYPWRSEKSFKHNITNLSTDTSLFNKLTRRSGLG